MTPLRGVLRAARFLAIDVLACSWLSTLTQAQAFAEARARLSATASSGRQSGLGSQSADQDAATVQRSGTAAAYALPRQRQRCRRTTHAADPDGHYQGGPDRQNELWLGHRDRANALLPKDPSLLGPEAQEYARLPGGHQEGWADAFLSIVEAILESAQRGGVWTRVHY